MPLSREEQAWAQKLCPELADDRFDPEPPIVQQGHKMAKVVYDEACLVRQHCPNLWEMLDTLTRPSADHPFLMIPTSRMAFSEMMAYRAGQDSIGRWLRATIDEGPPDTGEPDHG